MTNPVFTLTAEDLTLLDDRQFGKLRDAVEALYRLTLAEERRRREELAAQFEVLGRDSIATCLRHKRQVRWLASPVWWYHDDFPKWDPPEYRRCSGMLNAKAPIVITRRETAEAATEVT